MTLHDIIKTDLPDCEISGVTDDTREVVPGSVYVAIRGERFNGEAAAAEMLLKGAAAVITQTDLGLSRQILVPNARAAFAETARKFHGEPTSRIKLIGVTGTNGKSTTSALIKDLLESAGRKCGFIGTTCYDVCNPDGDPYKSRLSTPRQNELYALFAEMAANGAEFCVMETSSQALDQDRLAGERFALGIFTNLTQDHLDWHKTMERYYQAKKKLFAMCDAALICIDCEYGKRLARELAGAIPVNTYSAGGNNAADSADNSEIAADFRAVNIKTSNSGVSYWLCDSRARKTYPVKFAMPGLFNAANSAAAVAAATLAGVGSVERNIEALRECRGVRGRCEVLHDGDCTVICDYAHTEDALVKILTCIRGFAAGRIVCVFGAAGERDSDKRPAMGAAAAKYADELVITSDNPRFENPQKIIDEVVSGLPQGTRYSAFVDRREAIEYALGNAQKGDIVLLAGKGHETYQVIGDDEQDFDEREIVAEFFASGGLGDF